MTSIEIRQQIIDIHNESPENATRYVIDLAMRQRAAMARIMRGDGRLDYFPINKLWFASMSVYYSPVIIE